MQLKRLLNDDDAVSPVIGVILMVAITVILAAVIGTFVLGLGDQVQTTAPNANFQFDYNDAQNGNLTITHSGGDGVDANELFLSGDVATDDNLSWQGTGNGDTIRAGDSVKVNGSAAATPRFYWGNGEGNEASSDAEVRVVWQDADSDQSSTLRTWTNN